MRRRSKLERAATVAAVTIAAVGWADIAGRVVAHGGPLGMARSWRAHRIDAFLEPWATSRPDRNLRANR